jgi:tRNA 2-thiouridine synthesizing protein A
MRTIDCRGLSCPEPVLRARQSLLKLSPGEELEILVETVTSFENVRRLIASCGCEAEVTEVPDGFCLRVRK